MNFVTETGAILSSEGDILQIIDGSPGHVDFPTEDLLQYHKDRKGSVLALAHTHPPGMYQLSSRDKKLLKAYSICYSPYPARVITIAQVADKLFRVTTYFGHYESRESWIARNKESARNFEIIEESSYTVGLDEDQTVIPAWQWILINKSYKEPEDR